MGAEAIALPERPPCASPEKSSTHGKRSPAERNEERTEPVENARTYETIPMKPTPYNAVVAHSSAVDHPLQGVYVSVLCALLPTLLNVCRHICADIQTELDYLPAGFTFKLEVKGTNISCICRKSEQGTFHHISRTNVATDVESGSGIKSNDPTKVNVDYVICFRSLAYAFDTFIGNMSLQAALASRAFSTRGPNDAGVALTYMFTALLEIFFGWRRAYRN